MLSSCLVFIKIFYQQMPSLRGFQCRYSESSNYNCIAGRPMGYWRSSNENCRVPPSMNAPEILNIRLPKNIISDLYQCFQYSKMNAVSNWMWQRLSFTNLFYYFYLKRPPNTIGSKLIWRLQIFFRTTPKILGNTK